MTACSALFEIKRFDCLYNVKTKNDKLLANLSSVLQKHNLELYQQKEISVKPFTWLPQKKKNKIPRLFPDFSITKKDVSATTGWEDFNGVYALRAMTFVVTPILLQGR